MLRISIFREYCRYFILYSSPYKLILGTLRDHTDCSIQMRALFPDIMVPEQDCSFIKVEAKDRTEQRTFPRSAFPENCIASSLMNSNIHLGKNRALRIVMPDGNILYLQNSIAERLIRFLRRIGRHFLQRVQTIFVQFSTRHPIDCISRIRPVLRMMIYCDNADSVFPMNLLKFFNQKSAGGRIDAGKWLVEKNPFRLQQKKTCKHDFLLFSP